MIFRARQLLFLSAALLAAGSARASGSKSAKLQQGKAATSAGLSSTGAAPMVGTATNSQTGTTTAPAPAPGNVVNPALTPGAPGTPLPNPNPALPPSLLPGQLPPKPPQPLPPVSRFGRFDLDMPLAQLAQLPELRGCLAEALAPSGHAECALGPNEEKLSKLNLAWDDGRPGGELIALRLTFDPQLAPPLTDLEWQLTRGWGSPSLEQLRRDHDNKMFTLQWEDNERRATLEASGALQQPSRAVAIVLERKSRALPGDLATLHPKPFANMRIRMARRLEYDGQPYAMVWGTSLTPGQEALGESGPAWVAQRSYIGLFKLEIGALKKRWRPLWERTSGDEEDNDLQRITRVDTHDVTGDSDPDLLVELSCPSCGQSVSEVVVKTIRAGKAVDLLDKHDLYRASVDAQPGQVRIREAEGDNTVTVSTYAYDKSKGAFVLAREEREAAGVPEER